MNKAQTLALLGALGLGIGTFLPWATIRSALGSVSVSGYDRDGMFTGGIGVVILLIAVLHKGKPGALYSVICSLFAIVSGLILFYDLTNVKTAIENVDSQYLSASIGPGLYVSLIGALFALIGGLVRLPSVPNPTEPAPTVSIQQG